jgi:hypothetical protein
LKSSSFVKLSPKLSFKAEICSLISFNPELFWKVGKNLKFWKMQTTYIFSKMEHNILKEMEDNLQKCRILGSRMPDIFMESSGHYWMRPTIF